MTYWALSRAHRIESHYTETAVHYLLHWDQRTPSNYYVHKTKWTHGKGARRFAEKWRLSIPKELHKKHPRQR